MRKIQFLEQLWLTLIHISPYCVIGVDRHNVYRGH